MSQFIEMFNGVDKVGINVLVNTTWGSSPDSTTYNESGDGVPFYQGKTEFGSIYINDPVMYCTAPIKMAKKNDILMSVRAPVGAVNIATRDCCIGRGLASITPKAGKATTTFVYYALKYKEDEIDRLGTGSTFKAINKDSYAKIQMPEASFEDQMKFVTVAEQADKSEFDGFKSQFIEMVGSSESTKPLADFIEVSFPGEWGQEDKNGDGVKVIRTTNFTNTGKLDLTDVVTRDIDAAKVGKKKLKKGDIILERSGGTNDNPVGRVVYFNEEGTFLFNNFTQLLRCKEGVNPTFLFYSLFNYYWTNKRAIRGMGNKTTGIQNLKMDKYWQIPIADVPIECQEEFESIYNQADKSEYELQKAIKAIDKVIKSIINENL